VCACESDRGGEGVKREMIFFFSKSFLNDFGRSLKVFCGSYSHMKFYLSFVISVFYFFSRKGNFIRVSFEVHACSDPGRDFLFVLRNSFIGFHFFFFFFLNLPVNDLVESGSSPFCSSLK
jgi:hypothetical protein